jgi:hypothetical protein
MASSYLACRKCPPAALTVFFDFMKLGTLALSAKAPNSL